MTKLKNTEIKGGTIILAFDRYEEREELEMALKANSYHSALFDVAQKVFRPHRKHGYEDSELNKLNEIPEVNKAIELLEKKFYEILNDNDVDV